MESFPPFLRNANCELHVFVCKAVINLSITRVFSFSYRGSLFEKGMEFFQICPTNLFCIHLELTRDKFLLIQRIFLEYVISSMTRLHL